MEMTTRINGTNGAVDVEKSGFGGVDIPPGSDDFLILTKIERLPSCDFSSEVRPRLDAKHYFKDIEVLLDLDKVSAEDVVDEIISRVRLFIVYY